MYEAFGGATCASDGIPQNEQVLFEEPDMVLLEACRLLELDKHTRRQTVKQCSGELEATSADEFTDS